MLLRAHAHAHPCPFRHTQQRSMHDGWIDIYRDRAPVQAGRCCAPDPAHCRGVHNGCHLFKMFHQDLVKQGFIAILWCDVVMLSVLYVVWCVGVMLQAWWHMAESPCPDRRVCGGGGGWRGRGGGSNGHPGSRTCLQALKNSPAPCHLACHATLRAGGHQVRDVRA